jgi:hypothetical protein
MRWTRLKLGLLLAVTAGMVLRYGWADRDALLWHVGTVALMLGVLTVLSAFLGPRRVDERPDRVPEGEALGAPLLGQMLLHYRLISEADLERALEQHARTGKRLGRVVVEMGMATSAQVAEVLEEQLSRRGLGVIEDGERVRAGTPDASDSLHPSVRWEGYREEPSGQDGRKSAL